jgi:hypothetical protein
MTAGRNSKKTGCGLHLLILNGEMIRELKIIKENKQKRQVRIDPAFALWQFNIVLFSSADSIFYGIFRN